MNTQTELGWAGCTAVERDPQRVSGAWVFRGTRIPVAALFQNLEDVVSLAEFVKLFPGVTPKQPRSVLEHAARSTAAADHLSSGSTSCSADQRGETQQLALDSPGHRRDRGPCCRHQSGCLPGAAHSLSLSAAGASSSTSRDADGQHEIAEHRHLFTA